MKKIVGLAIILVAVAAGVFLWNTTEAPVLVEEKLVSEAFYTCDEGKWIRSSYYDGKPNDVKEGEMPVPSGKVNLVLSRGDKIILPQTISGSGIRYATSGESMIFWSKGETAFIVENGVESFSNCKEMSWSSGSLQLDEEIEQLLLSRNELSWQTATGTVNLCVFHNLYPEGVIFPYYLWVRCSEYKKEGGEIKELSGTSVPVKIDYPNELSYRDWKKFTLTIPRDGSLYAKDIKTIFPEEIWDRLNYNSAVINKKLGEKAEQYFQ